MSETPKAAVESFRDVFEHAGEAIFLVDAQARFAAVNRAGRELLGYAAGELEGQPLRLIHPPEDAGLLAAELEAIAADGVARREYRLLRRDGSQLEVERASRRLPDGRVCQTLRDIAERRRYQRELMALDERMRATIDGRPDVAVQWYDAAGRVRLWNRASEHMFGFTAGEAAGRTLAELIYNDQQQAEFMATLAGIHASGTPVGPLELPFRRRDGSSGTCLSTIFAIPGDDDTPLFVCMDVDLTERKRVEAELRQAQKDEVLGRLACGMAHDFNNILTTIVGFTELGLALVPSGSSELCESLGLVLESAKRGGTLTGNLLAFARKKVLAPSQLVLHEVVDRLIPLLRPLIGADIALTTQHDGSTDQVTADPSAIEQVIMNLVVNARDAMPAGGTLRLATGVTNSARHLRPGRYALLEVQDSGPGLSPEMQARVFEPFAGGRGVGPGLGLGLASCAGIVQQAGGHIGVESCPSGTTFRVHLPVSQPWVAKPVKVRAPQERARGLETVLVVEDEPTVRLLMERLLKNLGYQVLAAGDGREALEVAAAHAGHIDLLLTDLIMPELGGLELAEALLAVRPTTRVLVCSGYASDPDLVARHYPLMTKPYTPAVLARRVREVLDR